MILFYPKKNIVRALFDTFDFSPVTSTQNFPRYSISIYDDPNFLYPRQQVNGKQVLSIIDSDFNYSFGSISTIEASNYINGVASYSKTFYLKILVNQNIAGDTISEVSNFFVLSATNTYGTSNIKYYPVTCLSKDSFYTIYTTTITFVNSDFNIYIDGNVFLNLISDFSLSLKYPIQITATNPSFSALTSNINASTQSLTGGASSPYFSIKNYTTSYGYSSNYSQFSFIPLNYSNSVSLFNTTSKVLKFNDNGALIKISFTTAQLISTLNYFGFTFTNSSGLFNAQSSAIYSLIIRTNLGNVYRLETCKIINNMTSGYYNAVFEFSNLFFSSEYVDYILLEVQPLINLNSTYTITFFSFLNSINNSYNAFNLPSEIYTYDFASNKINILDVHLGDILYTHDKYQEVQSKIEIANNNYQLKINTFSIILPADAFLLTPQGYQEVSSAQGLIETTNGYLLLESKTPTDKKSTLLNHSGNYIINEVFVKNPIYLKDFSAYILPEKTFNATEIHINGISYKARENDYLILKNIQLDDNTIHDIFFNNSKYTKVFIELETEQTLFINYEDKKIKLKNNLFLFNIDKNTKSFTMKSEELIVINFLIIS